MNKATSDTAILSISLDRSSTTSLQKQLLQVLRAFVHAGRLRSEMRLPSSRHLARELGVSRVTTSSVYEQLIAEGYLEGRRGSGMFVASALPDLPIKSTKPKTDHHFEPLCSNRPLQPFEVGYPDLESFPFKEWTRLYDRVWRKPAAGVLGHSDPHGFGPLRNAIAQHLEEWRGITCSPEQVIVTSGLVDALELIAKTLLNKGDSILVEDPGHKVLVNAMRGFGARCLPVRVDDSGFNLSCAGEESRMAKAVAVTPSRQYPLGVTLPLARRLELLSWIKNRDGFIIEDDYDGEFRYQGQPLPAMMSLDESQRVIYVGSFSKVMFPALRLGYMVVPERFLPKVSDVLHRVGPRVALIEQPVLERFMIEGSFATHIRRMRRLYADRQKCLLQAMQTYAVGLISAKAETGGMHLVADIEPKLTTSIGDHDVSKMASELGLKISPLSEFFFGPVDQQGLVMGYAAHSSKILTEGIVQLSDKLRSI